MSRKRKALVLFALGVALLIPSFTYVAAQGDQPTNSAGLVPCGATPSLFGAGGSLTEEQVKAATECQACHLVELTQNIINFVIGIAIGLAVVLFVWAGILYLTAGAKPASIEKGKRIFKNTLLGFLIAICGWLIINTILYALVNQEKYPDSTWFEISCVSDESRTRTITDLGSLLEAIKVPAAPQGTGFVCEGDHLVGDNAGNCYSLLDGDVTPATPVSNAALPLGYCGDHTPSGIWACAVLYYNQAISSANCSPNVDGGNLACACLVNRVLYAAGYQPIDGDSVDLMEAGLIGGRGTAITDFSRAQPGDIVVWNYPADDVGHVGICANVGCTMTYNNSSSQARMNYTSNVSSGHTPSAIYRVNN